MSMQLGSTLAIQDDIDLILADCHQTRTVSNTVTVTKPDLVLLQPFFGWVHVDRIKKTIDSTTQFARASVRLPTQKQHCHCY
jgi:hypothetical protein